MKKLICLFLFSILLSATCFADNISDLVNIKIKNKDADAVILYNGYDIRINEDGSRHSSSERVTRILTQSGREEHADYPIFIDKGKAEVHFIKGGTYKVDGTFEPIEKAGINDVTPTFMANALMYGDFINRVYSFSSVEPNSTLYLHYTVDRKNEEGYDSGLILFETSDSTLRKKVTITEPANAKLLYETNTKVTKSGRTITIDEKDIPKLKSEGKRPPTETIGKYIIYTTAKDWYQATHFFKKNVIEATDYENEAIKNMANQITAKCKTKDEKIKSCLRFINQDIKYTPISLGMGSYKPRYATETLASKYGDGKDRVTLLKALLKALGIDSEIALIRNSNAPIHKNVPTIKQFDIVMLAVRKESGRWGLLDTVNLAGQTGYVKVDANSEALILLGDKCRLVKQEPYFDIPNSSYSCIIAELNNDGSADVEMDFLEQGSFDSSARLPLLVNLGQNLKKYINAVGEAFSPSTEIKSFECSKIDDYSIPVSMKIKMKCNKFALKQNEYFLLNLNPPPFKFSSIGFDTTVPEREYPYVLGNNRTAEYKYILQLPKNLEAIFVPESRTFSGKFGEFTVTSNYDKVENKIEYSAKTEIKTNQISPEDYKILKSNYEQFTNDENSILILKIK